MPAGSAIGNLNATYTGGVTDLRDFVLVPGVGTMSGAGYTVNPPPGPITTWGYTISTAFTVPANTSITVYTPAYTDATYSTAFFVTSLTFDCSTAAVLSLYNGPSISLGPATLPDGTLGVAYNQAVTASGGIGPYSYAVSVGALPNGLTLDGTTGAITGTPTASGPFAFTVTATDQLGMQASQAYNVTINLPVVITLSPASLPSGLVSTAYNQTITASGGTAPYTYAVTVGSVAPLALNAATGVLSGTLPATPQTLSFTITATDLNGATGSQAYTIVVSSVAPSGQAPSFPAPPSVPLCNLLNGSPLPYIRASVPDGTATWNGRVANVFCGPLFKPEEHGVLDRTVIHAVEVFALTTGDPLVSVTKFNHPIIICLQGQGTMLYRDANTVAGQKRSLVELPSYMQGGFTCVSMPNAGTIILVAGAPSHTINSSGGAGPVNAQALDLCTVTTQAIVNLRQSPDGTSSVLGLVPYQTTLKATARQGDFLQVIYGDHQGWLNAQYLSFDGYCGQ
jgi:hypothetical protein